MASGLVPNTVSTFGICSYKSLLIFNITLSFQFIDMLGVGLFYVNVVLLFQHKHHRNSCLSYVQQFLGDNLHRLPFIEAGRLSAHPPQFADGLSQFSRFFHQF